MRNQSPLSPARVLYEELREDEDAGLLDSWPAGGEADERTVAPGSAHGPAVGPVPDPEPIPAQTPEFVARRSSATSHGDIDRIRIDRTRDSGSIDPMNSVTTHKVDRIQAVDGTADGDSIQPRSALAAIIRLQSTEIERLALENDRLAVRLDAVSQLHEDERNRRRNLDQQLQDASPRNDSPAPAFDVEEIRRAAREGMSVEIKPVLMAILDLLETSLPRGAQKATPTATVEGAPVPASVSLVAEAMDDLQRLPEILTRPIEELTSDSGNSGSMPDRLADPPERVEPPETRVRRPRPPRHEAQPSAMPSVFAWTNLFS